MKTAILCVALGVIATAPALAEIVQVEITGTVEYNQITVGSLGEVLPGDPFSWSFEVDSTEYLDSTSYNTRGYVIDVASYTAQIGPATLGLQVPFPGTPYFVLRDNDPTADGFFTAQDVDWPYPDLPLDEAGLLGQFATHFEVGYTGDTLSSLDILDAIGTYDYDGLTSFYTVVMDGWAEPMGLIFGQLTIESGPGALGDMNCSGTVDFFDIDGFMLAVTDPAGYEAAFPDCDLMNGDCNGDGTVDFFDIDAFVALVVG